MLRLKMKRPSLIAIVGLVVGLAISSLFPGAALARPVQPHFNRFLTTHAGQDDAFDDNDPGNPANGDGGANGASQEAYDNEAYPGTYIGYNQAVGAS
ncbi:MAG: hypothetical protein JO215_06495, partial [Ktedonobacteraceae bacterium]|nr:hypothetical protein [Ktedonobacteraceae bacterium]